MAGSAFRGEIALRAAPTLMARRGCTSRGPVEAVGRGVAQIAPELFTRVVDDMGIGGSWAHQKSTLDACPGCSLGFLLQSRSLEKW